MLAALTGTGLAALAAPAVAAPPAAPPAAFDVRAFGATGDGVTFDTAAIQAAIDACAAARGGRVVLQGGTFLTRTIRLKSNVTLYLEAGAVLLGTADLADYAVETPEYVTYTYSHRSLVYAEKAENVSILGKGAIDLQGKRFPPQTKGKPGELEWGQSPYGLRLVQCRNLTIRDVTIRNCPMAAVRVVAGEDVLIEGVSVDNRVRISCDGIEVVSSRRVCLANCRVVSWDDAICLKSSSPDPCRDITITNCTVSSLCNGIKLGTESVGGFENISISNCTLDGGADGTWRSINGLALMIVDGGRLSNVCVSNLVVRGFRTPLFVRLADRGRMHTPTAPKPGIGTLRDVVLRDILAETVDGGYCGVIAGEPGHPVADVVLDNVRLRPPGGGTAESAARVVPHKPATYPESTAYGPLPAHGLYVRHAAGLTLRDVRVEPAAPDARPALVCEGVADLEVDGFRGGVAGGEPVVRLRRTRGALLRGCRPLGEVGTFLRVEGADSGDVALLGNDLRRATTPVAKADGFTGEVAEAGNLT